MRLIILCFLFLFSGTAGLNAQTAGKNKPVTKSYKPPKLFTMLGNYKDSLGLPAGEVSAIIGNPLHITDGKKGIYKISSYQFLYRRNAVTEDEATGKISNTTSMVSSRFKTTPLPEPWINAVRENPRKGEFLYFFDVIVMDDQGRLMFAPDLKITVL